MPMLCPILQLRFARRSDSMRCWKTGLKGAHLESNGDGGWTEWASLCAWATDTAVFEMAKRMSWIRLPLFSDLKPRKTEVV